MQRWLLIAIVSLSLATVGCGKDEPKDKAKAQAKIKKKRSRKRKKRARGDQKADAKATGKASSKDSKPAVKPKEPNAPKAATTAGGAAKRAEVAKETAPNAAKPNAKVIAPTVKVKLEEPKAERPIEAAAAPPAPAQAAKETAEPEPKVKDADEQMRLAAAAALAAASARGQQERRGEAQGAGEPSLDVAGYLTTVDLERVLGKKKKFKRGELPGVKATRAYNAVYFAPQKGRDFGVSLQVWRDGNLVDSRTRFNTMKNTYTDVVATNRVTEQGFRAHYGGVVSLVFVDPRRPLLATVSCSTSICKADKLIELSRRVAERLR